MLHYIWINIFMNSCFLSIYTSMTYEQPGFCKISGPEMSQKSPAFKHRNNVFTLYFEIPFHSIYCKDASSRLFWLVANSRIFRLFMKGKFYAYVLWHLAKIVQNWIVDWSTAPDFTVPINHIKWRFFVTYASMT